MPSDCSRRGPDRSAGCSLAAPATTRPTAPPASGPPCRSFCVADSALLQALILGIVEGITEFLPISSTGHLILAADLIDATGERWNVFNIAVQTGAMLAV